MKYNNRNETIVLEIGNRFFARFGKTGRVMTAWSLSGAYTFAPWRDEINNIEAKLIAKKKNPIRRIITFK